jgi:hypothetical protein
VQAQMKINPQIIYGGEEDLFENEVAFALMRMTLVSVRLDVRGG